GEGGRGGERGGTRRQERGAGGQAGGAGKGADGGAGGRGGGRHRGRARRRQSRAARRETGAAEIGECRGTLVAVGTSRLGASLAADAARTQGGRGYSRRTANATRA